MNFCKTCSEEIHNVLNNKILSGHEIIDVKQKLEESETCRSHGREYTHFCIECVKPLCADCIAFTHNYEKGGEGREHKL